MATGIQVVFAAKDPARLAAFWQRALRYAPEQPPDGFSSWEEFAREKGISLKAGTDIDSAVDPDGRGPRFLFERDEPRPRGAVHIDINPGTGKPLGERRVLVDQEVERLIEAGATKTRVVEQPDHYWVEMTDPEGNWFCVQ
jgi:hypothetical protein